jgi:NADH-quinone oxidoreductase subunit G
MTVEQNKGQIYRFMPRDNDELNKTWMCDEGRFSFDYFQTNRLNEVRVNQENRNLAYGIDQLAKLIESVKPEEVAGIASPTMATEDLYVMKKLFEKRFNLKNLAAPFWGKEGEGDNILKLADKTPNRQALKLLGFDTEGKDLLARIEKGDFKVVLMVHNNPFGQDEARAQKIYGNVKNLIVLSVHQTKTVEKASMSFPVRTFIEKNGTFVNATSRLQRFRQSVEPENQDVIESSMWLACLANALKVKGFDYGDPVSVFNAMAKEVEALKGLTFNAIPSKGVVLQGLAPVAEEPFKGVKAQPNVLGKK